MGSEALLSPPKTSSTDLSSKDNDYTREEILERALKIVGMYSIKIEHLEKCIQNEHDINNTIMICVAKKLHRDEPAFRHDHNEKFKDFLSIHVKKRRIKKMLKKLHM